MAWGAGEGSYLDIHTIVAPFVAQGNGNGAFLGALQACGVGGFFEHESGYFVWKPPFIDAVGPAFHPGYMVDKVRTPIDFGAYTD